MSDLQSIMRERIMNVDVDTKDILNTSKIYEIGLKLWLEEALLQMYLSMATKHSL